MLIIIHHTDIDECALEIDGCEHICNNDFGSFFCSCNGGYSLAPDSKYCIRECYSNR